MSSSNFYTYFLRQGSINPELFQEARLLNRPASKSRGSSHVYLSVTGITGVCHHVTPVFMSLLRLWFCTQDTNARTTTELFSSSNIHVLAYRFMSFYACRYSCSHQYKWDANQAPSPKAFFHAHQVTLRPSLQSLDSLGTFHLLLKGFQVVVVVL